MKYQYSYQTDKGNVRVSNQDSLLVTGVRSKHGQALLAAVCDGVGGLSGGEQTSRLTAELLQKWAEYELPQILAQEECKKLMEYRFGQLIQEINKEVYYTNQQKGIVSGTTLSAMIVWDNHYVTGHVGDSRIYRIRNEVTQITTDHSLVAFELAAGRITPEEAKKDSRQNVITQSIGTSLKITPEIQSGTFSEKQVFVLCTDGFWHLIETGEWLACFSPDTACEAEQLKQQIALLVQRVREKGERDNITAIAIYVALE